MSEGVDRHTEEGAASFVLGGQVASSDIHLQRGDDEARHGEGAVAGLAHLDEAIFAGAAADMDVVVHLVANSGLPLNVAAVRAIVVAHEQPCRARHGEYPLDRTIEGARIPGNTWYL